MEPTDEATADSLISNDNPPTKKAKKASSKSPRDDNGASLAASAGVNKMTMKQSGEDGSTSSTGTKKRKKSDTKSTLIDPVLYCLTEGIPRMELKAMIQEADEAEKELLHEIHLLEQALAADGPGGNDQGGDGSNGDDTADHNTQIGDNGGENESEDSGKKEDDNNADESATPGQSIENSTSNLANRSNGRNDALTLDSMLENHFTPLDRCFTLSALLGRLRDDLAMPSIREPPSALLAASSSAAGRKKKANSTPPATYTQILGLASNPNYTRVHPEPPTQLLNVWRKIASHRTAMVFRRPVKPEEAPGYTDRILFPMDLSLVRKMIVARILTTFADVHQRIRLISHNCVKYNGRESDYGIVAREFEAVVDEYIVSAVHQHAAVPPAAAAAGPKFTGRASPRPTSTANTNHSLPPTEPPPVVPATTEATGATRPST